MDPSTIAKAKCKAGRHPAHYDIFPISGDANAVIVDTGTLIQRKAYDPSQVFKI